MMLRFYQFTPPCTSGPEISVDPTDIVFLARAYEKGRDMTTLHLRGGTTVLVDAPFDTVERMLTEARKPLESDGGARFEGARVVLTAEENAQWVVDAKRIIANCRGCGGTGTKNGTPCNGCTDLRQMLKETIDAAIRIVQVERAP